MNASKTYDRPKSKIELDVKWFYWDGFLYDNGYNNRTLAARLKTNMRTIDDRICGNNISKKILKKLEIIYGSEYISKFIMPTEKSVIRAIMNNAVYIKI
jgi:hypothetical protein